VSVLLALLRRSELYAHAVGAVKKFAPTCAAKIPKIPQKTATRNKFRQPLTSSIIRDSGSTVFIHGMFTKYVKNTLTDEV
jgi:hypothetical protein